MLSRIIPDATDWLERIVASGMLDGVLLIGQSDEGAAIQRVDVPIRGGTVYSSSVAPFVGDVAVTGERIRHVGRHANVTARRTIDARGLVVAPGFIDPHAHVETMLAAGDARERLVLPFLMQGVTTAVTGNDREGSPGMTALAPGCDTGINHAAYVGFGAARRAVIGEARRAPTASELAAMRGLVARAMCAGAAGLSTGLFYAPQSFATTDEVVPLAREAGSRGDLYDSHIRKDPSYTVGLAAAIDEAIAIVRAARMTVHISHIKALGIDAQGQAPAIVAKIAAAARR